jgi:hypothetical protein
MELEALVAKIVQKDTVTVVQKQRNVRNAKREDTMNY